MVNMSICMKRKKVRKNVFCVKIIITLISMCQRPAFVKTVTSSGKTLQAPTELV